MDHLTMTSDLVLYHYKNSTADISLSVLRALGIPFELISIDSTSGDLKAPSYIALNPNGLVPLLVHKGTPIYESAAITIYLGENFGEKLGLFPPLGPLRGEAFKWIVWGNINLMKKIWTQIGTPSDENATALHNAFNILEDALLNKDVLLGSEYSLIDTHINSILQWVQYSAVNLTKYERLSSYMKACNEKFSVDSDRTNRFSKAVISKSVPAEDDKHLTLFWFPLSTADVSHNVLKVLGIPFELKTISRGDTKTPSFLALNPNGFVPLIVHHGTPIYESVAITIYLGEMYGVERGLFPPLGPKRGEAIKWIVWVNATLTPAAVKALQTKSEADFECVVKVIMILDGALEGKEFLLGEYSLVDTHAASALSWWKHANVVDFGTLKRIPGWLEKCELRVPE
ncbi:thioredoxin-like protein [Cladochytrium replicatum]|nr:thioredoxin-like protein [Cladochytrium replicatum]